MGFFTRSTAEIPAPDRALAGREQTMPISGRHVVLGTSMIPPFPEGVDHVLLGMGCFWGAEEIYWLLPGVHTTAVGYAGGVTPNPTYEEVCSGGTGHTEVALVAWQADAMSFDQILRVFWEHHDPTQGMRQGNDVGTQYRSAIYTVTDAQLDEARRSSETYAAALAERGLGDITTEIAPAGTLYFAEEYHQQYLAKNPNGYRCHARSGVPFPDR